MKFGRNQKGFTLTEAMVVGIIGAVVAVVLVAFLRVHNDAVNEGIARSRMQLQSDVVSGEIARKVREANLVLASGEIWSPNPNLAVRNANRIALYDGVGNVLRCYSIEGGDLKEGSDNASFQIFKVANDTIRVDTVSSFRLSSDRKSVALNLRYSMLYRNKTYQAFPKGDVYSCRN